MKGQRTTRSLAREKAKAKAPTCVFCGASEGAQFAVFTPRFKPFGTACVKCEAALPPGTVVPATHE